MLPSFLLSLREGLEAALIIGIVVGVLHKLGRRDLTSAVWRGAAIAGAFSLFVAFLLQTIGAEIEGRAEEIFEGSAMLVAAVILTWMIFWMRRQSNTFRHELETGVRKAANQNGQRGLFLLAFFAIAREGLELSLFLTASAMTSDLLNTTIGAMTGLFVSSLLGYLLFSGTRRLNLKNFFQVTNILLILFAAGLVAHGFHEFNEAGLAPSVISHIYDLNPILDEGSALGTLLTTLFGYNGNPSLTELTAYLAYFTLLWLLFRTQPSATTSVSEANGGTD